MTETTNAAPQATTEHEAHGFRRKMVGKVIKREDAQDRRRRGRELLAATRSTASTSARARATRRTTRRNQYKVGDEVEIQEHRPISRDKRFIVTRLVKKFVEE